MAAGAAEIQAAAVKNKGRCRRRAVRENGSVAENANAAGIVSRSVTVPAVMTDSSPVLSQDRFPITDADVTIKSILSGRPARSTRRLTERKYGDKLYKASILNRYL